MYNDEGLKLNLNLLDKVRDSAVLRLTHYKQRIEYFFNKRIKIRSRRCGAKGGRGFGTTRYGESKTYLKRPLRSSRSGTIEHLSMDVRVVPNT